MSLNIPRKRQTPPSVGIRLLREAHGMNIPTLARRIEEQGVKVSADHISNVELGWKRPSKHLLHAWARALGISPLDIVTDEPTDLSASA